MNTCHYLPPPHPRPTNPRSPIAGARREIVSRGLWPFSRQREDQVWRQERDGAVLSHPGHRACHGRSAFVRVDSVRAALVSSVQLPAPPTPRAPHVVRDDARRRITQSQSARQAFQPASIHPSIFHSQSARDIFVQSSIVSLFHQLLHHTRVMEYV